MEDVEVEFVSARFCAVQIDRLSPRGLFVPLLLALVGIADSVKPFLADFDRFLNISAVFARARQTALVAGMLGGGESDLTRPVRTSRLSPPSDNPPRWPFAVCL